MLVAVIIAAIVLAFVVWPSWGWYDGGLGSRPVGWMYVPSGFFFAIFVLLLLLWAAGMVRL